MAQAYTCRIDEYLMLEIRECYMWNSAPSDSQIVTYASCLVFNLLLTYIKLYLTTYSTLHTTAPAHCTLLLLNLFIYFISYLTFINQVLITGIYIFSAVPIFSCLDNQS
jgi:hypothetical protein